MLYDIFDPNWVRITQGNTVTISIDLKDPATGSDIALSSGDKIIFTVKNKLGKKVIQKILSASDIDPDEPTNLLCEIAAAETKDLLTGEYLYDCLYVGMYGQITTFISSIFQIFPAIGLYTDIEPGPIPPEPDLPENTYVTSDGMYYVTSDGYIYVTKGE